MSEFFLWYFFTLTIGWLAFPLAYRLLPALPDRGYTASKALGLLLWGYIFWLLNSLGILQNNSGSLLVAGVILAALSAWALRSQANLRDQPNLRVWLQRQRGLIVLTEVLFLAAFIGWTVVRAANPEAVGTEKPMELAFINAILSSPALPPHDPWLSGYAISYYYFGYVIVAILAKITGTAGGVAFNLGIALVFALSASGAYGLVYNLLAVWRQRRGETSPSLGAPLLGPLFLLFVSNVEGFLHSLHTRGLFWTQDSSGALTSGFWRWLDIKDLNVPPAGSASWIPTNFWWWWRASRVLQDYDLAQAPREIIDEFPFFSYLLGDLHPHVLAMPFGLLAIALALNVLLGGAKETLLTFRRSFNLRTLAWLATLALPLTTVLIGIGILRVKPAMLVGGVALLLFALLLMVRLFPTLRSHGIEILLHDNLGRMEFGYTLHIHWRDFLFAALILGGMAFLNTWDFPFYVALFAAAYAAPRALAERRSLFSAMGDFFWLAVVLGITGGLLYLPFYLGFSSQAGGILPNVIFPTRGAHLWVMFAPLLIPIIALLGTLLSQKTDQENANTGAPILTGLKLALGLFVFLFIAMLVFTFMVATIPQAGEFFLGMLAASDIDSLFRAALLRRAESPGGWLTLLALFTLVLAALLRFFQPAPAEPTEEQPAHLDYSPTQTLLSHFSSPSHLFVLLLILLGALLVTGPEFFYLRDQFGWRMNTIFKFYYQAWLLWSIAAAYASAVLLQSLRSTRKAIFGLGWALLLAMSLVYPLFSLGSKTNNFNPAQWTLDSSAYLENEAPDAAAAIEWLRSAPSGVLAEAVPAGGGSYTSYARFATHSGQPGVLGWYGHESQWRGGGELLGPRQADLERLYCTKEWKETQTILERYQIRYIIVGPLERSVYRAGEASCPSGIIDSKFARNLRVAFKVGQVTIYEYPIGGE